MGHQADDLRVRLAGWMVAVTVWFAFVAWAFAGGA